MLPSLSDSDINLDRTHRVGRTYRSNNSLQDIFTCVHHFCQKEDIMNAAKGPASIDFEAARLSLFQDLSPSMLQRRCNLRPATPFLQERGIKYKWGPQFRLIFR